METSYDFIGNSFYTTKLPEPPFISTLLNKQKCIFPKIFKKKSKFPDILPNTIRVFMTNCNNENNTASFGDIPITYARCEIIYGKHCCEAPYMLDFLINWYNNLTEETVVFTHAHVTSWHITNITKAVFDTMKTKYFEEDYGGFHDGIWKKTCDRAIYQDMYNFIYNET